MTTFKVMFTESAPVVDPAAFVYPTERRWNDFTFNFRGIARFQSLGRQPLVLRIFVMPFEPLGISKKFGDWFDALSNQQRHDAAGLGFVTLLASPTSYAELRKWSEDESEYLTIIESLKDITWLIKTQGSQVALAARSEEFMLGVLRSGAAYRAFRAGYDAPITASPTITDARTSFVFQSTIDEQAIELPILFKDNEFFEDRVHCLVGKNGVGKSRLLASLIQHIAKNCDVDEPAASPKFNRVLVYTTEAEPQFPTESGSDGFDYRRFSLTERASLDSGGQAYIGRMLVDLLREREDADGPSRYGAFKHSVAGLIPWESLCVPLFAGLNDALAFTDEEGAAWARYSPLENVGEQRRLTVAGLVDPDREYAFFQNGKRIRISSGQRTFLRFALHFASFVSHGALVVVDEPETHLHPNLVSQFMLLLNRMLVRYKAVALIATHSIYVVREVPTYCNHVLSRTDEGALKVDSVYLPTLGASPTALSMAIFGDDTVAKVTQMISQRIAKDGRSILELIPELEAIVSSEMLMEIRAMMETKNEAS